MTNIFTRKIISYSCKSLAALALICIFSQTFKSLSIFSGANAQSADQIEMARQLGIDIDDYIDKSQNYETSIGQQYEDFVIAPDDKDEPQNLSKYLGFSEFEDRYGSELFSNEREDYKIADDAQAPEDYILGLGDQIVIQYYGAENDEFILDIDRSGSILLPKIGPVMLNGLNLAEARSLIRSRVETQLVGVKATITVGNTKFINIFVAGNVISPGVYSMPALSRVTHALYTAGGISDLGTFRNIQVKRQGKIVGSVDLYDFLVNGDNSSDINLHPNDVVLVGPAKINIQVRGAVKRPGIYELIGNEDIKSLINIFGGFAPGADSENVSYSSLVSENPTNLISFEVNKKIKFYDGDNIFIKFKPSSFQKVNNTEKIKYLSSAVRVRVQGEVRFPGDYLLQNGERLSSLIERAGGLTEDAFLNGAVFTRENIRQREALRARELAEDVRRVVVSSSQTQEENQIDADNFTFISEQLESYNGVGRLIIDLPRALAGRSDADLKLLDGDALFIPTQSNTVSVFGEVRRESSFVHNKKYSIEDYITMAAGITRLADEDNIYIVKANGFVEMPTGNWFKFGGSRIVEQGDSIIVPVDYSYRAALPFWRDVISIVYQGAVAIAAISGL